MNIKQIIKSRLVNKDKLGDWYLKRVETCLGCEYWSGNTGKSKNVFYKVANFGKEHCTKCGCPENKLRLPEEECPLTPPKWRSINPEDLKVTFDVINKSTEKVIMSNSREGEYIFDYGTIERGSDGWIEVNIKEKGKTLHNPTVSSSCGCTTPKVETINNVHIIKIKYNTNILNSFKKTVTFSYKEKQEDKIKKTVALKIVGVVKPKNK